MALYCYVKAKTRKRIGLPKNAARLISSSFLLFGVFLIGQAILPIFGWYFFVMPGFSGFTVSPLPSDSRPPTVGVFPSLVRAVELQDQSYQPKTWFMGAKGAAVDKSSLKEFHISVPKLRIDQAIVAIGGDDLKKSLIAWPTSAPPGTFGNTIVFGHSELPQFASPDNYSGIFTFLMDLMENDEIIVDYDGLRHRYLVVDKTIVSPTDLSVLEQRFDSSYITLITCVPPGTVWKRGVIRARMTSS